MSESGLLSVEEFVQAATSRIAQLDQAEAVLGSCTIAATFLADARKQWVAARASAQDHGIQYTAMRSMAATAAAQQSEDHAAELGATEVFLALAGVQTLDDAIDWLTAHTPGGHRHG